MKLVDDVRRFDKMLTGLEQLVEVARELIGRSTQYEQLMRSFSVNDVLWSGSLSVATVAHFEKSFPVDFAALSVVNLTNVLVDFANRPLPTAFNVGPGMFQLPALGMLTLPTVGRTVSVWTDTGGTVAAPNDKVLLVVSARPLEPNGATL